jgi:hypothetical protein
MRIMINGTQIASSTKTCIMMHPESHEDFETLCRNLRRALPHEHMNTGSTRALAFHETPDPLSYSGVIVFDPS